MKKVLIVLIVTLTTFASYGQNIDHERMNRDLDVAENVFITLLNEKTQTWIGLKSIRDKVEGSYLKDYGVIISAENAGSYGVHWVAPKIAKKNKKSAASAYTVAKFGGEDGDSQDKFIDAAKTFLADYSHLIGQLKDDDHIKIKMSKGDGLFAYSGDNPQVVAYDFTYGGNLVKKGRKTIVVEVGMKDVNSYKRNSISREQLMERIKVSEKEINNEVHKDLALFASIFQRLYQIDLSSTYYASRGVSYEKLEGFGAIFKMRLYSSYVKDNLYILPTLTEEAVSLEERNEKVQQNLPKFKKEFKENLVNYARTINSIKDDETVRFEVKMTECDGCQDFPSALKFVVSKSVIDQYSRGSLGLEQAVAKVEVEKSL